MTRDDALRHCQAYLDKQLDPKLVVEIEQELASDAELTRLYENQRSFHDFLARASGRAVPANDFQERLRARLSAAPTQESAVPPAPVQLPVSAPGKKRWLLKAVAVVVFVLGIGMVWHFLNTIECPYMVACAREHAVVLNGKAPLELSSTDAKALADFVSEKTKSTVVLPSDLKMLKPVGAGTAKFASLKTAPQGAFVRYDQSGAESVTILIHPWPEETPRAMNLRTYKGKEFWSAKHGEFSVAVWKSADGKLLCSVISKRPKDEVLELAFDASEAISKKVVMSGVEIDFSAESSLARDEPILR